MRKLNLFLILAVTVGLMVIGTRLAINNGTRLLAQQEATVDSDADVSADAATDEPQRSGSPVAQRIAEFLRERETRAQAESVQQPVPDVISEDPQTSAQSKRHGAVLHAEMITPGNFEYLGGFLPPHFEDNESSFAYSSGVLAFRPDPERPETAHTLPGTLFLVGHSQHQRVAEISIPRPFLSKLKKAEELPRAELLQPFADVTHGIMQDLADSLHGSDFRLGGLYVIDNRLHWTTHVYYNPGEYDTASHGSSPLNLTKQDAEGPCHLGDGQSSAPEFHSDKHAGYIFRIPEPEADKWFGGNNLISGLWTATGLQNSSHGPSMFAYRLPVPLPSGGSIAMTPLVWYPMSRPLSQHHAADRWGGGAWLTLGSKQSVIIVGQKALGPVYYGLARPEDCDENKGYHGPPYESQVYFYSPASLIHAAHGAIHPNDQQPWMRWTDASEGGGIGQYLFPRCYRDVGGVAYDQEHSLLYVSQPNAGVTLDHPWHQLPVIHVFRIVE